VTVHSGIDWLVAFYSVLERNLAERHGAKPVHQLDELHTLAALFPDEIILSVAVKDDAVVAGVLFFRTSRVIHAQYIASSTDGFGVSALDAIFDEAVKDGIRRNIRYLDFGTSNEDDGRVLNEGLYRYKTEFGGGGVAYDQYDIDCT